MSEPTSGDQKPGSDSEQGHDEVHDQHQTSDSVFNDPTAPVWADPTAPMPASPASPAPAAPAAPTQPQMDSPAAPPPATPPMSNPYAQQASTSQQPPAQPYGQPAGQYGQQAGQYGQPSSQYGQQQPGQQYPAYGQQSYAPNPSTESNTSAIVLTIVSGVVMLSTCFVIGIPSLIFGIMALTSNSTDPLGSRKKAKTGWILFAVNAGVVVLLAVVGFALLLANSDSGFNNEFSY